jgi:hypothetical protein
MAAHAFPLADAAHGDGGGAVGGSASPCPRGFVRPKDFRLAQGVFGRKGWVFGFR